MGIGIGLLGPVELSRDGAVIPLSGVPQRVLLARLALAGGRPVPVTDLIEALWEGEQPDNALGNLHSYVSRLRRCTGADVIRREPGGYRLDLPDGAVDTERVERLVETARGREPATAAGMLAEALGAWRGDPLADVADRLAFAPEVARLAEWRRHLREEWLDRRVEAGAAAEALPEIEALATAEPLRERAHLLLMRALHVTGRTPEALVVARAFRDRLADGHGVDPSPLMGELQRRILTDDPALRVPARSASDAADGPGASDEDAASSPAGPATESGTGLRLGRVDRFFGRREELAALRAALAAGRVTTLVGPGGVGKTRLTSEALTGGELVVELAERSVPADVAAAVAGALGLRTAPRGGVAALAERIGATPATLVLDNCEHLLEPVRVLVGELVARCPGLRVLATSRHRLDVAGERVLRIGPLPADDQVALFCDRAALLRAGFTDDARTRELAAAICRLVDGLPLAVELAARREAVFGLAHLRDRLGAGLNVLEPARGGDRATAVSATVEWSYRLLDPAAQRLLDRLAVCRGGFTLDALPHFAPDAEPLLAELVDASLIVADPPRYRLLETVRHVGLGHLGPDGERQARDAHARWMLAFADDLVRGARERDPWTYPAMRRELANLQEALTWLSGGDGDRDDGARLAARLAVVGADYPDPGLTEQLARWAPERVETPGEVLRAFAAGTGEWLHGRLAEADRLLTAALDRMPAEHDLRWGALLIRISNEMFAGRPDAVRADAERMASDPMAPAWARATGICCSALMDAYGGDPEAGGRWLEKYAGLLDTEHLDGFVPFTRGELLAGADPEQALAWYDRSIAANDRSNLTYTGHIARVGRAAVLIRLGRRAEAITACREVIVAVRDANMTAQVWTMVRLSAELLADLGDAEIAAALVAAADADPFAPAVMGPDRIRLDAIRAAVAAAPPLAGGMPAAVTAVGKALARAGAQGEGHD
ncbi:BTAD domain-containing putative transcriptional regulator [Actinoplanes sp. NEAU-A12]|uniref:BTAD domain-containing putative transcriptional regulator n=1 Tax=Actinoplanes sandaracinus TaxID=3045177 RepID=A0ABT6WS67_9ACTN|nr:BTAD domain-containing putative transcriptional regulator [Actinoplanes sandaracinus]MDI6102579.1 BTAD domain-containing putative transcriptional regulator [Actinoplanes sandaracinus]